MKGLAETQLPIGFAESAGFDRRPGVLTAAGAEGLLGAKDSTINGRVPAALVRAAKARSGITSDSELLMYALAKVAIEDSFADVLLANRGAVPRDIPLDI